MTHRDLRDEDMDLVELPFVEEAPSSDNSQVLEAGQPSVYSPSRGKEQEPKTEKKKRGAPEKKGRDLDTFFPKMRNWIRDHTHSNPVKITFKTLPSAIALYRNEVYDYLIWEACQLLPPKATSKKGRQELHKRLMFKKRATKILREYFKFSPFPQ